MKIVAGPRSEALSAKLAEELNAELVRVVHKVFPDGESYVRLEGAERLVGEKVALVQSLAPPQDKSFFETLLMLDALKRNRVEEIGLVVPYLAYARQDKVFLKGEPVSVDVVLRSFENEGVSFLVTVDVHNEEVLLNRKMKCVNVTAVKLLAEHIVNEISGEVTLVSPDVGRAEAVRAAAEALGCEFLCFEKHRDRITGKVEMKAPSGASAKKRAAVILDDIISTGGTIKHAAKLLRSLGAKKIYAGCVHMLASEESVRSMREAGVERIISTDTLESPYSKISVAPLLARTLKELLP